MNRFHYLSISLTAFSLLMFRLSSPADQVEVVLELPVAEIEPLPLSAPATDDQELDTDRSLLQVKEELRLARQRESRFTH